MPFFVDQLDDAPVFEASPSLDGGQVSNIRANLLKPNQAQQLINLDIAPTGIGITRRGTNALGPSTAGAGTFIQGLLYYSTPSNQLLIVVNGTGVRKWDGSAYTTIAGYTAGSSLIPVQMVQGISKVYLADGTQDIFSWDGTTMVGLGHAANNQPPALPKLLAWHTSRLIASGIVAEPDALYFSQFLDGATWDKTLWQIRVGGGEANMIKAIVPWTQFNLLVFKTRGIWVVDCTPTVPVANFQITNIHPTIGCLAPRTAVQVGSDVLFLSDSGVRSVEQTIASDKQPSVANSLSYPIQDIIDRINPAAIGTACAAYWNNRYRIALPLDTATTPNYIAVYNKLTDSWSGTWTGLQATCFAIRDISSDLPRLCMGLNNGVVTDSLEYVRTIDEVTATFQDTANGVSVDIPVTVKTRSFTGQDPTSPKTGLNCELEFSNSLATSVVSVVLDNGTPIPLQESPFVTGSAGLTLPFQTPATLPPNGVFRKACDLQFAGQFRELQVLVKTTAGKLALRNVATSSFPDTIILQK